MKKDMVADILPLDEFFCNGTVVIVGKR